MTLDEMQQHVSHTHRPGWSLTVGDDEDGNLYLYISNTSDGVADHPRESIYIPAMPTPQIDSWLFDQLYRIEMQQFAAQERGWSNYKMHRVRKS